MTLRPLVVLAIVALLLATGCATVSFKRGAGPGNAKADEDACRATSASEEAYADCLRERGWMVRTPGALSEPEAVPAPEAEPPPAPPSLPAPASAAPAPVPVPGPKTPPVVATPRPATGTTKPASGAPTAAAASEGAKPIGAVPAEATAPAKKPLDPMAKVTASSWWKLGGTNADLERAVAACVDELGAPHRPNVGPTEVTIAMRDCLRAKKWFPVGGNAAR